MAKSVRRKLGNKKKSKKLRISRKSRYLRHLRKSGKLVKIGKTRKSKKFKNKYLKRNKMIGGECDEINPYTTCNDETGRCEDKQTGVAIDQTDEDCLNEHKKYKLKERKDILEELRSKGKPAKEVLKLGYNSNEMLDAGYSPADIQNAFREMHQKIKENEAAKKAQAEEAKAKAEAKAEEAKAKARMELVASVAAERAAAKKKADERLQRRR